jgi:serine phosphatase RsbU (regulator of sigma subunit)/pSer/pThr/pTyr-binding forkhead associated (FHA) protein
MAFLELIRGREPGTRFELATTRAVIGRSGDCDVPLDVAAISRRHAAVLADSGLFYIEDLGSRNGTFVNDSRIDGKVALQEGDRILICDQLFSFHTGHRPTPLAGTPLLDESSLTGSSLSASSAAIVDDGEAARSHVVATLEMGGKGSTSWRLSAKPEVKLNALIEISHNLGKTLSLQEILPKLLDSLFKIFVQADRGFVIMRSVDDGPLVPVAVKARRPNDEENMRISRTIIEEAISAKKAILSADAASDERFNMAQSIADFHIRSMICAPMLNTEGHPLGVIQIDTTNQRSKFSDEDLEVLAGVASQAAIAVDHAKMHEALIEQRAMQRDLELASRMQRALLPASPPEVSGYYFFNYYESARQVGGDYYDYVPLADGRVAVVVGDVAGKGVSAALLMARLSSDVRFTLASEPDPARAVTRVNELFGRHDWQDRFVTMIVAVLNPNTNELLVVNAGHMAPLLRRGDGLVEEIGDAQSGPPIGVVGDYQYESFVCHLSPGESVIVFTDGFSEAMNDQRELYGIERLARQVGAPHVSLNDLGDHLLADVRNFVAGHAQSDDMCLACFGRLA